MKRLSCVLLAASAVLLGGCYGPYGYDELARYDERKDTITPSAGDAKEVAARTHMETPWPVYVGDRRISTNGDRMARAVGRYRVPPPPPASSAPTPFMLNAGPPPGAEKPATSQ